MGQIRDRIDRCRYSADPMRWATAALFVLLLGLAVPAASAEGARNEPQAREVGQLADERPVLRVGTSGDYAPFSLAGPGEGEFQGFDIAVARAFAEERGAQVEFVRFRWRELISALAEKRFDVAMSGVTVRADRSTAGRFSVPVAETGAVALVPAASTAESLAELDRPGVRVVVNQGGHLERVARAHLPRARIETLSPNDAVRAALIEGRADAAITDTVEAPHWRRGTDLRLLGPFTRDRKAWLLRADSGEEAARLDRWLLAREADGSLSRWRMRHGLEPTPATAEPLAALERFVLDLDGDPRARRFAFEWIRRVDETATDRLIPGMLDDPGVGDFLQQIDQLPPAGADAGAAELAEPDHGDADVVIRADRPGERGRRGTATAQRRGQRAGQ